VPTSSNINDNFFNGIYQEVWRRLIPEGLTEAEVDFIMEEAGLKQGDSVLDLMCGYGRHALELARRGINVTCVDNQPAYIKEINDKKGSLSVNAICSKVTEVALSASYKAVICMGNSFNFFNRDEASLVLKNVVSHLDAGGALIINSWTIAEIAIKYYKEKDWFYVGDMKYLIDNTYYLEPARIETDHIIISPDGKSETIKGIDHIFTLPELNALLGDYGLNISSVYSTPRKRPFKFGDTRAYIVAGTKLPS
jgi:ubiquinone/menaquinone biosynthesis C-methylase UbiE